jgi:hypothetical protein
MRRNSGLFELKFSNELEKQEWIERSLVDLIQATEGSISMLKFQNIMEKGLLAAFFYFGYPLLGEQAPESSATQAEQGLSFWGKTLLTCSIVGCIYYNRCTVIDIEQQEKIRADSIRDLLQVRQLIAELRAQPPTAQTTNTQSSGVKFGIRN